MRRFGLFLILSGALVGSDSLESVGNSSPSPAHAAALNYMRGINLGNYLEAPPNTWGNIIYTTQDFNLIRAEGFDHVRLPIAWHYYLGPAPGYALQQSIFGKVDFLVTNALNRGLAVVIDLHHFDAFTANPAANTNQFYAIWRQVAAHYKNFSVNLAFELLNEPREAATTRVMNPIYREAIRQIRLTNPTRTIFLGTGNYNNIDDLGSLIFPPDDFQLIATVHSYEPFYFTHQGAEWALPDTATTGVIFPGPPATPLAPAPQVTHSWVLDWFRAYNRTAASANPSSPASFRPRLQKARQWSNSAGRPVYIGEFGCYEKADPVSRVNFYREMRAALDQQSLGWAMWDWKAGFHYIKNGKPDPPGLREALFPQVRLVTARPGELSFTAATGKRYVIERTASLVPMQWQPIATQTLSSPIFLYQDPDRSLPGSFYRVEWLK